jgi:hypothetical protein
MLYRYYYADRIHLEQFFECKIIYGYFVCHYLFVGQLDDEKCMDVASLKAYVHARSCTKRIFVPRFENSYKEIKTFENEFAAENARPDRNCYAFLLAEIIKYKQNCTCINRKAYK